MYNFPEAAGGTTSAPGAAAACPRDVVFVMDESGSVTAANFETMKSFVSQLIGRLDVDNGNTRVAIVAYSSNIKTSIKLNVHSTAAALQSAVMSIRFTAGGTNTGGAIQHVRQTILTAAAGDRANAPNSVVVLTDGKSNSQSSTEVGEKCPSYTGL